jgi:RNA polymerase sigma-70 factor (ECF subfamily)
MRALHHDEGPSDGALLAGMAVGDEVAGISFVRRYQRRVFGLALSMVGDPGLAEDIAQEALVRVWKHAPVYDERRGGVSTWVFSITRNLAIDALRVRRAVPTEPEEIMALSISSARGAKSPEGDPESRALMSDETARVRTALATVPEAQRRALILAAFYGRSAAEVSEIESIPLGTAKTRIRGGLLKLRAAMAGAEAGA